MDFFANYLDVCIVSNRVLGLSKDLIRETYSMKVFVFNPSQNFKDTADFMQLEEKKSFFLSRKSQVI